VTVNGSVVKTGLASRLAELWWGEEQEVKVAGACDTVYSD